jgi:hypothetical protein
MYKKIREKEGIMRFYKSQNGFYLYLWLTLFTLFISFFSIILFNYVSSDIRTTKELIRKAKRSSDLKSLILIATNIYRQDSTNSTGNIPYKSKNYQYQIKNIDGSRIYIKILENDNLLAKAIVEYKINLGNSNKLYTKSNNNYYFNANSYYNNATSLADKINIEVYSNKIFRQLFLKYNTQPYKVEVNEYYSITRSKPITDEELTQKYTEKLYRIDIDPINYYNNFLIKVIQQLYSTPSQNVELNNKGVLIVKKQNDNNPNINFNIENNNQKIDIFYNNNQGSNNNYDSSFILVREPQTFDFDKNNSSLITNDRDLANDLENQIRNSQSGNNINFTLNPDNGYVYKVLKRRDNYIIYKTRNSLIYILVFATPIIGSDSNLSSNNGIIKEKIYLITPKNYFTTIKGHILYEETANKVGYLRSNIIDPTKINKDNIPVTNNNNLFTLVTENIILDGSNFNSSNTSLILCGKYVAMYNDNSTLSLSGSGYLNNIYVYGGIHSAIPGTIGLNEYYSNDKRLSFIDPIDLLNIHTDKIIAIDFNY